ncbi:MAG TPA: hypothetical protein VF534_30605 [Paraburkholderia sp.]|uniref:tetratricopeptide repeat protein n=1 Tax=Variovorax sp. Varisp62 TaxID=3243049 RepID=UPI002F026D4E
MTQSPASKKNVGLLLLLLGAVICALYMPAVLGNSYAWDDWELFINSPYLRDPTLIAEGLVKPIIPGTTYFRPLPLATFALEFYTGGVNPIVSHAINLIFHLSNTALVGLIFMRLSQLSDERKKTYLALIAMTLYGVHPTLVEAVAWAAGRFDLMVTFFYLSCLWVHLRFNGVKRILFMMPLYFCACFSKEMAVTLPVVIFFIEGFRSLQFTSSSKAREYLVDSRVLESVVCLGLVGLLYLGVKSFFFAQLTHVDSDVASSFGSGGAGGAAHTAFVGHTLLFYARMVLWPFSDLSPHHPFSIKDLTNLDVAAGILVVALVFAGAIYLIVKRSSFGLFLVIGVICLLPVSNIIPLTIGGNIGHERFLVLPMAFFCMAAVSVSLSKVKLSAHMKKVAFPSILVLASLWIVIAAMNVRLTAPLWRNDLTLWKWAYEVNPNFYVANIGYAGAAVRYQQFELAGQILEHAKKVDRKGMDNDLPAAILEARVLGKNERYPQAIQVLEDAMETLAGQYRRKYPNAKEGVGAILPAQLKSVYYTALTEAYVAVKDFEKARINGELATFYGPAYSLAWFYKALASYGAGNWPEGQVEYAKAHRYMIEIGVESLDTVRKNFLGRLCGKNSSPVDVCSQFAAE